MRPLDRICAARTLLETTTPLKKDCGLRCGAACCRPDEDGKGGMLLLPGEEALYAGALSWGTVTDSALFVNGRPVKFLTCRGACPRAMRPFSCRVFPLTPAVRGGAPDVELDVRAWPVCPLMGFGMDGLSREFVAAVRAAVLLLAEDPSIRAYFAALTDVLDAFRNGF